MQCVPFFVVRSLRLMIYFILPALLCIWNMVATLRSNPVFQSAFLILFSFAIFKQQLNLDNCFGKNAATLQ